MEHMVVRTFLDAVVSNDYDTVEKLFFSKKITDDIINLPINNTKMTALVYAAKNDFYDIVKILIEQGANIEASDEYGMTALLWACARNNGNIVELLIDANANLNRKGLNGFSPLMWLCYVGNYILVEELLKPQYDINIKNTDDNGNTPLMLACKNGNSKVVEKFKDYKNYLDLKNNDGYTALMFAVMNDDLESICILLGSDADHKVLNKMGLSAYDLALIRNNSYIIDLLEKNNARTGQLKKIKNVVNKTLYENKKSSLNLRTQKLLMFLLGVMTASVLLFTFAMQFVHLPLETEKKIIAAVEQSITEKTSESFKNIEEQSLQNINEIYLNAIDKIKVDDLELINNEIKKIQNDFDKYNLTLSEKVDDLKTQISVNDKVINEKVGNIDLFNDTIKGLQNVIENNNNIISTKIDDLKNRIDSDTKQNSSFANEFAELKKTVDTSFSSMSNELSIINGDIKTINNAIQTKEVLEEDNPVPVNAESEVITTELEPSVDSILDTDREERDQIKELDNKDIQTIEQEHKKELDKISLDEISSILEEYNKITENEETISEVESEKTSEISFFRKHLIKFIIAVIILVVVIIFRHLWT